MTHKLVIIGNGMAPGRMLEHLFEANRVMVEMFGGSSGIKLLLDPDYGFASFGTSDAASFWKRGSARSGSNIGSSRSSAGVSGTPIAPLYGIESSLSKAAIARSRSPKRAATRAKISIATGPSTASRLTLLTPSTSFSLQGLFVRRVCSDTCPHRLVANEAPRRSTLALFRRIPAACLDFG